jgi:hypothetical protein
VTEPLDYLDRLAGETRAELRAQVRVDDRLRGIVRRHPWSSVAAASGAGFVWGATRERGGAAPRHRGRPGALPPPPPRWV